MEVDQQESPLSDPAWNYLRLAPEALLAIQSKAKYSPKKSVWVADSGEGFIPAEITAQLAKGEGGGQSPTVVKTSKGIELKLSKDELLHMNPPKFELTEDMGNLTYLNEATVLHNLRQRYYARMIYTYSGLFCVAINPYSRLPIYSEAICRMYIGKRRAEMPPHLFAICDEAYHSMVHGQQNQSMLITGESGAGKTENTKKVIAYFAIVGAAGRKRSSSLFDIPKSPSPEQKGGQRGATLEEQVVRTNPVLEAFGNAKTVRNNNSSRFGKFIRIHFDAKGRLTGADIEHYLLEKSRVIKQAAGERSYHIFYQLVSGAVPGLKEKLLLNKLIRDYHFVSGAEVAIEGVNDGEEMLVTDESFDIMRFSAQEKFELYALTAAVMHMGELRWKQRSREEQAECEDEREGDLACRLFGVDTKQLIEAILRPKVKVGSEWVSKGQTLEQVTHSMGALAKATYARMFGWLIKRCNASLDARDLSRDFFIGVLDIAGFEIFEVNGFEQLWINFVNERLQQFFNHHMFVLEQEEYAREGIKWEYIDFGLDLQACIELIEKPLGVISMLDEECIVPKATDATLAQKLLDQHLGKHPNFMKAKQPRGAQSDAHFAIRHYAGTVPYNVRHWLEKNRDPLNESAVAVLKASKGMALLPAIWADDCPATALPEEGSTEGRGEKKQMKRVKALATQSNGGGMANDSSITTAAVKKKANKSASFMLTVSMIYRESLNNLMTTLQRTHPHFIRCIIPNEQKGSGLIEANLVLNQLACNGVLEGIRICRKGYPNRVGYAEFTQRYTILATRVNPAAAAAVMNGTNRHDPRAAAMELCEELVREGKLKPEEYQCGTTKAFFRTGVLARLEEARDMVLGRIITELQRVCRHYLAIARHRALREREAGVKLLQRNIRKWCHTNNWHWLKLLHRIRPLVETSKKGVESEVLVQRCNALEADLQHESKARLGLEEANAKLTAEKAALGAELRREKEAMTESTERCSKLADQKKEAERQLTELTNLLAEEGGRNAEVDEARNRLKLENDSLKRSVQQMDIAMKRQEVEKEARDQQTRSLQAELANRDECIAKLTREKKHHEENYRKAELELRAEQEKLSNINRVKSTLEQSLDAMEDTLERERRSRVDLEKQRRKVEGELRVAQENHNELMREKQEEEQAAKRKDMEIAAITSRLEDEEAQVARLQRQIKELATRVQELEEEVTAERQTRAKVEKMRNEMHLELEELSDRLDEAGGASAAQAELNKRREAELAKLRRELEEQTVYSEQQLNQAKKKQQDAVQELSDQLDAIHKSRANLEKEKQQQQREMEDLQVALDAEMKKHHNADRLLKQLEAQLVDSQLRGDEVERQLHELLAWKERAASELVNVSDQLEEVENQLAVAERAKAQLVEQVDQHQRRAEVAERDGKQMASQLAAHQRECQLLREALEDEQESRADLQRILSKANAEAQQCRAKLESEGVTKVEELEEVKRRMNLQTREVQEQLEQTTLRLASTEKRLLRQQQELEDAQLEAERANSAANSLEKRQHEFDKVLAEWRRKVETLTVELETSQRESRQLSTEILQLRSQHDESAAQNEALRRENKALAQELTDISEQLGEGGKNAHEAHKSKRRLELEKEELQQALEDAEAALEAEENKVQRAQVEISQLRAEIDKRIAEKEQDFENTRKNHQRALDSAQASLEVESRAKADLLKAKTRLQARVNELEVSLENGSKANEDAQRSLKNHKEIVRELQQRVEEVEYARDELRDQLDLMGKRFQIAQKERAELTIAVQRSEEARRQAEANSLEAKELAATFLSTNSALITSKKQLEEEIEMSRVELNAVSAKAKEVESRERKAVADAARLDEELRMVREHSQKLELQKKALEMQMKELRFRMGDATAQSQKEGKQAFLQSKLEQRLHDMELELQDEARRHQETQKTLRNKARSVRELEFQVDEGRKATDRTRELVEKLQAKLRTYKTQAEEAGQLASANLNKYKHLQHQLESAEERANLAENDLIKVRSRSRPFPLRRASGPEFLTRSGLNHSISSAAVMMDKPFGLIGGSRLTPPSRNVRSGSLQAMIAEEEEEVGVVEKQEVRESELQE